MVEDWSGEFAFMDVGAIVYYLHAVLWMVVGFSVETHLDALLSLQSQLEKQGRLSFEAKKYYDRGVKTILMSHSLHEKTK